MDDIIRSLLQDVARNEAAIESLKDRMDAGDKNVRQGVENLKEVFTQLQSDMKVIANEMLGPEGKQRLRDSIMSLRNELQEINEEMKNDTTQLSRVVTSMRGDLNELKEEFRAHTADHRESQGAEGALKMLKKNWVYPVATGIVIVLVTVILNVLIAQWMGAPSP